MSAKEPTYVAAIDIGGSNTKTGLVSNAGLLRDTIATFSTRDCADAAAFLGRLVKIVEGLQVGRRIEGIGIAVPGLLSRDGETVDSCPNAPILIGHPWRRLLAKRFGIGVKLEVDGNAAGLGEYYFGAGRRIRRLMVLSLGTGVGGCMLVDGEPLRFTGGCCGDIGHTFIGGDAKCSAGCKGCLESVVSVQSLSVSGMPVDELIRSGLSGNEEACATLRSAGRHIGKALATLTACFNPELVLLAGGIAEAGDLLTGSAAEALHEYGAPCFQAPIRKAGLGGLSALAGCAVPLVCQRRNGNQDEQF
jgi:glucokinase